MDLLPESPGNLLLLHPVSASHLFVNFRVHPSCPFLLKAYCIFPARHRSPHWRFADATTSAANSYSARLLLLIPRSVGSKGPLFLRLWMEQVIQQKLLFTTCRKAVPCRATFISSIKTGKRLIPICIK